MFIGNDLVLIWGLRMDVVSGKILILLFSQQTRETE